jgi:hypothetical protein
MRMFPTHTPESKSYVVVASRSGTGPIRHGLLVPRRHSTHQGSMIPATRHPWTKIRMMPAERGTPRSSSGISRSSTSTPGLGGTSDRWSTLGIPPSTLEGRIQDACGPARNPVTPKRRCLTIRPAYAIPLLGCQKDDPPRCREAERCTPASEAPPLWAGHNSPV